MHEFISGVLLCVMLLEDVFHHDNITVKARLRLQEFWADSTLIRPSRKIGGKSALGP